MTICVIVWEGMCVRAAYMCVHTRNRRALVETEDIQHNDHAVAMIKNGTVASATCRILSQDCLVFF